MDQGRHGVALFGLGRIGVEHFKNMLSHPGLSLLWVIEQDIQRAKDILIKFQQCNSTKIITPAEDAQVFADERVHGIVVCTPSFTHVDIILKAVKAGKAVFCEKPVSPTLEGVMQVYTEAQKQKVPLFCGFNRRFDQQIRKIHDYAQDGRVGKKHVIKMCSRDPAGKTATPEYYKNYGGFPNDSAVHDIDVVCWLMKERPISVYAVGHAHTSDYVAMGDVDTLVIVLNFPSGAKGIIDMSRNSPYGFDQRIEIFGEKGLIASENPRQLQTVTMLADGTHLDKLSSFFMDRYSQSYVNELEHFVAVLDGKTEVEVKPQEVVIVSKIAKACQESIESGQVVKLNLDAELECWERL